MKYGTINITDRSSQNPHNENKSFILISLFAIMIVGCLDKDEKNSKDPFYTNANASWDVIRIPLIKPYELIQLNGSGEWTMNLQKTPSSASNVKGIAVVDSTILIHSVQTYCQDELVPEAWFIVSKQHKIEKGFVKAVEFKKVLLSIGIKNLKFHNVDSVFNSFSSGESIQWK